MPERKQGSIFVIEPEPELPPICKADIERARTLPILPVWEVEVRLPPLLAAAEERRKREAQLSYVDRLVEQARRDDSNCYMEFDEETGQRRCRLSVIQDRERVCLNRRAPGAEHQRWTFDALVTEAGFPLHFRMVQDEPRLCDAAGLLVWKQTARLIGGQQRQSIKEWEADAPTGAGASPTGGTADSAKRIKEGTTSGRQTETASGDRPCGG